MVTGAIRSNPPQACLGGILADVRSYSPICSTSDLLTRKKDMGLGKTLTMLALIMGSLRNTVQPFIQRPEEGKERSTLIITPLSGEFLNVLKRLTYFFDVSHSPLVVDRTDKIVPLVVNL